MKKWFYFIPFVLYNFFKKRNGQIFDAYWNSIMAFIGFFILGPMIIFFRRNNILFGSSDSPIENRLLGIAKIALVGLLISFIFTKKRLESLAFSKKELKIANIIVVLYFLIPITFFIGIIIKVLVQGK